MSHINLDGRSFSPVANSENGRVDSSAVFDYKQKGLEFEADYYGRGFTDGHLIGLFTGSDTADLVYHCRAPNGDLEVGQAKARFSRDEDHLIHIHMDWQWLNLDKSAGQSHYKEIPNDT